MSNFSEQTLQPWQADLPTYADPQSQALIQRCLAGEDAAYVTLYNEYGGMIYRLCMSLLQNREDAEEVLQDSFEYAFRRLDQYDANKSAFKTWLYRIAVSRCHNKRRRKWLPTFSLSQLINQGQDVTDIEAPSPAEMMQLTEKQQVVWAAIQALSDKLRETAVLRYYEGFSFVEIGQILGIPTKTAESRMRLAHNALRKALAEQIEP
ncbi:RNA polymerase sigma factor [Candidatus Leptofilum sp.]|uniref:RNA polymerase sigma factor n=1 Tax=Candidatus Leptofilum sp. TaxID=3241576 RepID=UPI003B5C232E